MAESKPAHEDDGRVICSMDVEGMPQRGFAWKFVHRRREQAPVWPASHPNQLTPTEARYYTASSLLAGLSVVLVYAVAMVLFILFCTNIWFR